MIETLVPAGVVAVETTADLIDAELFEQERTRVDRAVEKRRREFVTGRECARRALERLGIGRVAVPAGAHGEPHWPEGVVGSLTHCQGFCACVVAMADEFASVGIDAELHAPLPDGLLARIATSRERQWLARARADVQLDLVLFSAKEAVYKAWYPLVGLALTFEDVEVRIDPVNATFKAWIRGPAATADPRIVSPLRGRWCARPDLVATAVVLAEPESRGENHKI